MTILPSLPALFASHGGFGLNLNLFETNILNLAIVIAGLWKFLPGFLGSILERRRQAILSDLSDAEERLASATAGLATAQQELAAAQQRAEQIRADGKSRADALRVEIEKRTIDEMARLKQGAIADMNAEASRVSAVLRREAAKRAIERALGNLSGKLDADAQARLIDQSIQSLGNA
ncbi:MAG: F0F1 ATP synthase subunit B [Cyanobacteriota bacterium]|nr:F0F1 ATP synthase subunit B [Cyanobacteriota bacterium]